MNQRQPNERPPFHIPTRRPSRVPGLLLLAATLAILISLAGIGCGGSDGSELGRDGRPCDGSGCIDRERAL